MPFIGVSMFIIIIVTYISAVAYFTATASGNTLSIQTDSSMAAMLWISLGMLILLSGCCIRYTCNTVPKLAEKVFNIGRDSAKINTDFNPNNIWNMALELPNSTTDNPPIDSNGNNVKQNTLGDIISHASNVVQSIQQSGLQNNPYIKANTNTRYELAKQGREGYEQPSSTFGQTYQFK